MISKLYETSELTEDYKYGRKWFKEEYDKAIKNFMENELDWEAVKLRQNGVRFLRLPQYIKDNLYVSN